MFGIFTFTDFDIEHLFYYNQYLAEIIPFSLGVLDWSNVPLKAIKVILEQAYFNISSTNEYLCFSLCLAAQRLTRTDFLTSIFDLTMKIDCCTFWLN